MIDGRPQPKQPSSTHRCSTSPRRRPDALFPNGCPDHPFFVICCLSCFVLFVCARPRYIAAEALYEPHGNSRERATRALMAEPRHLSFSIATQGVLRGLPPPLGTSPSKLPGGGGALEDIYRMPTMRTLQSS